MRNLLTNYGLIVYKNRKNKYITQYYCNIIAIQFIYTVFKEMSK